MQYQEIRDFRQRKMQSVHSCDGDEVGHIRIAFDLVLYFLCTQMHLTVRLMMEVVLG